MKYTSGRYTSGQLLKNIHEIEDWITAQFLDGGNAVTDTSLQKDMAKRVEDASFGKNACIFDDNNRPSIYVKYEPTEKARLDWLSNSGTHFTSVNTLHPAFIVNSKPVTLYIGKYLAAKISGTNYGVSLKGLDPANYVTFDQALTLCSAKGTGHHLMTQAEWAYLSLLAIREGFQPRGNDYYGLSSQDTSEKGKAAGSYFYDDGKTGPTKTGSGPASWNLDGTPFSPADLRGNVREWNGGFRLNVGEIQVLENNNAADNTKDQSAASTLWKAILQDGSLVAPGTSESLKFDFISAPADTGDFELNTTTQDNPNSYYGDIPFASLAAHAGVTIPELLIHLGIMPPNSNAPLGQQYMRNVGERLGDAGGSWFYSSYAGLGYRDSNYERTNSSNSLGFRPAFYEL